jgi:NADPH-dependent 2,4-dienoyl-CoA reductase/sulfur reductase-like enzyme
MRRIDCDVAVIGGGPAGLAAAAAAKRQGAPRVVIVERDLHLGGILQQCIHPGFGLNYYHEELTGPEYAGRFIDEVRGLGIEVLLNSMVLEADPQRGITCVNPEGGMTCLKPGATVMAMGCRERTRANLRIPGSRPSGIYTAGTAQRLINRQNCMVGRKAVILGSGDIGMIMARRLTLEGAEVLAVVEIMDYLSGLNRNRVQCLDDFGIPLLLSHTVTEIVGNRRIEGVKVAEVDGNRRPRPETERFMACDTLLLSVGLIPENELTKAMGIELYPLTGGPAVNQYMQTERAPVFACGNVLHVNDLVDNVSVESGEAGRMAACFASGSLPQSRGRAGFRPGLNVRYICPQYLELPDTSREITLHYRVSRPLRSARGELSNNRRIIKTLNSVKMNPGEMEHVTLDSDLLEPGELTLDIRGDE